MQLRYILLFIAILELLAANGLRHAGYDYEDLLIGAAISFILAEMSKR